MRAPRPIVALSLAASLTAAVVGGIGCNKTSGTGAAKEDMQLAPRESDIVFMVNIAKMRNTPMFKKAIEFRDTDASQKKDYDDFVKRCAFDPFQQLDSVYAAFPQTVSQTKEFTMIMRGTFNQAKLVECAKDQSKKDGTDVVESTYNGKTLYTDSKKGEAFATFLDAKTVVIGGKEWVKKTIDLAAKKDPGGSAKDNEALMSLVKRARTNDGIWAAGTVPQSARDSFGSDPQMAAAKSMKDVFGSLDFSSGFSAEFVVDLGSEADAKELTTKTTAQLMEVKKSPQLVMMGMASFLDGVKIDSKGVAYHVAVNLTQPQVDDLVNRMRGLLKSFGGMAGGAH